MTATSVFFLTPQKNILRKVKNLRLKIIRFVYKYNEHNNTAEAIKKGV